MMKTKIKSYLSSLLAIPLLVLLASGYLATLPLPASASSDNDCVELAIPIDGRDCIPRDGEGADNPIMIYLRAIVRFLSAGVGLVVIGMIIVGGIQYSAARDNAQAIEAAKKKITNAIIGLVLFMFMAAIMNFLIPGGIL